MARQRESESAPNPKGQEAKGQEAAGPQASPPSEAQARETTARERVAQEQPARDATAGPTVGPAVVGAPTAVPVVAPGGPGAPDIPNTAGGPGSERSALGSGVAPVGPVPATTLPTRQSYSRPESIRTPGAAAHQPADSLAHAGIARPPRFGVIARRPVHEAGGELTVAELAALVEDLNRKFASRDLWGAMEDAGELLTWAGSIGSAQHATRAAAPQSREEASTHEAAVERLKKAAGDFERVRAEAVAWAPQIHTAAWHQAGGPVSGAPVPMAPRAAGVNLNPQSLLALLEVVAQAVQLIRGIVGQ